MSLEDIKEELCDKTIIESHIGLWGGHNFCIVVIFKADLILLMSY